MRIAIVGSNGYIAAFLKKSFFNDGYELVSIDQSGGGDVVLLNLEQPDAFDYKTLDSVDFVVYTAAISGPDKCAEEFDKCWNINVEGTGYFIHEAIKRGCNVLFFSSDAVYGDIPGEIYTEMSGKQPFTAYGKMKDAVEEEFWNAAEFKAIRLSYVMSDKDRFISYCLNCIKNGDRAEIFHPFYRNVVAVSDVVKVVSWFIENFEKYDHKVLNVTGDELVSRVRMADELNRIFDGKLNYTVSKPDEGFFRNRPMITQMKSLYLEEYGILDKESFTDKIQKEMRNVKI